MANNVEFLFYPGSIAVVGVSDDPHKLSSIYFNNLVDSGYKGKLFPVNPKHTSLYGYPCFAKVSDIPEPVDQVAILIPAQFVLDVIKDCALKGVKTALIISAGFGELGEEGKKTEQEMVAIARQAGMRILGPNIIGVLNTAAKMNSSWMQLLPRSGDVSFLSQSGAFCTAVLDMALNRNLGFYNFCSIGNKSDLNEYDLIDYWYQDQNTKVIGAYLEEISNGFDLLKYLDTQQTIKPLILFKPGKSNEAVKAIVSHTGSLAGSREVTAAAIRQSGIVEANTTTELISDFMAFSWSRIPKGNRVAIITNAGGPGIMATDGVVQNGLTLAPLTDATKAELAKVLPPASNLHNPVDILGDAQSDRYLAATDIIIKDPNVDLILYIITPQYITQIEDTAKMIIRTKKHSEMPIFTVFLGEKYVSIGIERMYDARVPVFSEIDEAVKAIADLIKFSSYMQGRKLEQEQAKYEFVVQNYRKGQYQSEVEQFTQSAVDKPVSLPDELCARMSVETGLDLPRQQLCASLDEAKTFAAQIYPVVLKAPNELLAHKTEFKAVYVNLKNDQELSTAFSELLNTVITASGNPAPKLMVQEMITAQEEIFIGANRDGGSEVYAGGHKGFGHLIVTGKGGVNTEVYKDLAYVLVPAAREQISAALDSTKVAKSLHGFRGMPPLAIDKLLNALESVQKLLVLYPQIISMDINPVLMTTERAVAVDIKLYVQK